MKKTMESPFCTYSFFLFSKLYDIAFNPIVPYDYLYEDVCREYGKYCDSAYNDETIVEYECMVNYLQSLPKP
jgi:hypothetical protein